MPLDASIYGQIQPVQQANPLNALAQAMQIRGAQAALDKADRDEQRQNRLLGVLQSPEFQSGDTATRARLAYGAGDVDAASKITTAGAAANKDQREADRIQFDMAQKRYEFLGGAMGHLAQNPQDAQMVMQQLVQGGIMTPEYAQKVLAGAAQAPDARAFFTAGANAAISAKDKMAQQIQMRGQDITRQNSIDMNATSAANNANTVSATMRGQDMTDARAREANLNGRIPSGYRQASDGNGGLEYIPGGPADPNAAKKASPTEFQGKSAAFGSRAQEADRILAELGTDYSPAGINTKNSVGSAPVIGGALEAGANAMLSDKSQKAEQAQRDFVNAILRQESGAAIGKDEFNNAKRQYFPQPGDSEAVIAQKAQNRKLAVQGLLNNAGNAVVAKPAPAAAPLKTKVVGGKSYAFDGKGWYPVE